MDFSTLLKEDLDTFLNTTEFATVIEYYNGSIDEPLLLDSQVFDNESDIADTMTREFRVKYSELNVVNNKADYIMVGGVKYGVITHYVDEHQLICTLLTQRSKL